MKKRFYMLYDIAWKDVCELYELASHAVPAVLLLARVLECLLLPLASLSLLFLTHIRTQ